MKNIKIFIVAFAVVAAVFAASMIIPTAGETDSTEGPVVSFFLPGVQEGS